MPRKKRGVGAVAKPSPVDRVERWPLADIKPYAKNARVHSPEQIAQITASMQEFGQAQLILVDGDPGKEHGTIIAGHGRLAGAKALGWGEATVAIAVGWSKAQKHAYRIADNKIALNSSWDDDLLKAGIVTLQGLKFDLSLTGFTSGELEIVMNGWSSDINVRERFGENTDGIHVTIKVVVAQADAESARDVISGALDKARIKHEV